MYDANIAPPPHSQGVLAWLVYEDALPIRWIEDNLAGGDHVRASDHVEQRRFTCPRLTDHTHKFTCIKVSHDAIKGGEITCSSFVYLDHLAQLDAKLVVVSRGNGRGRKESLHRKI
jgi:hypothetical protein